MVGEVFVGYRELNPGFVENAVSGNLDPSRFAGGRGRVLEYSDWIVDNTWNR
jgi:hypothetical protein